ncbi:helix-turn-helix domain-containing protein [Streptomyces sp. NPDC001634]|uniref:helix-turn-helix domain-containing protein n=1 Tax=Streptomyces sp. NPDC001634 TaxID=3154390 RepID=UPI00331A21CE
MTTTGGTLRAMDKRSLTQMAQRFREAETRAEILRQELAEAIRQAAADGVPQKDICEATGYTRQQVRRIVLAGGSEAGEVGTA